MRLMLALGVMVVVGIWALGALFDVAMSRANASAVSQRLMEGR